MKIFLVSILVSFLYSCGGICNKENSCSTDSHNKEDDSDDEKNPEDEVEIVIKDDDSLPACDDDNNNQTAYRESSGKFFICKTGAWEEFTPAGFEKTGEEKTALSQKEILDLLWKDAKTNLPEETYLTHFCASLLTVDPKHECQDN
jgi:hypothetical protein